MYRNILVPLDGSRVAEQAMPTAAALANATGAALTLLRVHEVTIYDFGSRSQTDGILKDAETLYLSEVAERVSKDFNLTAATELLEGTVVDAICSRANSCARPLIVMSTHGRTGLSRLWLGSVADGILHHATTPVLMLRAQEEFHDTAAGWPLPFRTIVVPLDGTEFSEQVLPHAAAIAEASAARLQLLHVVSPVVPTPPEFPIPYVPPSSLMGEVTESLVQRSKQYTNRLVTALHGSHPTLDVKGEVGVDDAVARVIIESARRQQADLVAMATHARGLSRLVVSSVADKVVRAGPGAVLLIRPQHD